MRLIVGMDEREDDVHLHEVIPCAGEEGLQACRTYPVDLQIAPNFYMSP